MESKKLIYIGIIVGGTLGGWLGSMLDHGNMFGAWSIILGTIGSVVGIWLGWRLSQ